MNSATLKDVNKKVDFLDLSCESVISELHTGRIQIDKIRFCGQS